MTVWDREHCCNALVIDREPGWVASKRTPWCATHLLDDLPVHKNTWMLNIVRDGRDVVTSQLDDHYYCGLDRWIRDVMLAEQLAIRHARFHQIRYESLVATPDVVQRQLTERLSLHPTRAFSKYPAAMPGDLSPRSRAALGGVRPIDTTGVGRWRTSSMHRARVSAQLRSHPEAFPFLVKLGYC